MTHGKIEISKTFFASNSPKTRYLSLFLFSNTPEIIYAAYMVAIAKNYAPTNVTLRFI